jgi:hypothetical protein
VKIVALDIANFSEALTKPDQLKSSRSSWTLLGVRGSLVELSCRAQSDAGLLENTSV